MAHRLRLLRLHGGGSGLRRRDRAVGGRRRCAAGARLGLRLVKLGLRLRHVRDRRACSGCRGVSRFCSVTNSLMGALPVAGPIGALVRLEPDCSTDIDRNSSFNSHSAPTPRPGSNPAPCSIICRMQFLLCACRRLVIAALNGHTAGRRLCRCELCDRSSDAATEASATAAAWQVLCGLRLRRTDCGNASLIDDHAAEVAVAEALYVHVRLVRLCARPLASKAVRLQRGWSVTRPGMGKEDPVMAGS